MQTVKGTIYSTKIEKEKRFNQMKQEQQKWVPALQDLSMYIDPTRGIFNNDRSRIGKMINHKILLDSQGDMAKRITSSGLQTGLTDQTREWFKLTLEDFLVDNSETVREWLDETTRRMHEVLNKSNLYKTFQHCYDELVQFGTGCFIILEDFDDVVRAKSFTAGEYFLSIDNKGRVDGFAREFDMTVSQMVDEFGLESCSVQVQAFYNNNELENIVKIRNLIERNRKHIPGYSDVGNMPYASCYWEAGNGSPGFLATRGFKRFPVVAPRWETTTTDMIYGYGPAWKALGDIKELQMVHKDMLISQEKYHNPPVMQDASVEGHVNLLPGGVTKTSGAVPNSGARPAYQINLALESFRSSIDDLHQKINKQMFADLFLMISTMDRTNITAFEVAKREQEKMMMLGPVLHTLSEEMHDKVIDLVFDIMLEGGMIPEPPPEIQGMDLKVQYISILAQAQRAVGIEQIRNTIAFIGEVSPIWPEAKDNIDIDKATRFVANMSGAPASIVIGTSEMDETRQARQQQQNQMIAMQAAQSAADTGKTLSDSKIGENSMLDVVGQAAQGAVANR